VDSQWISGDSPCLNFVTWSQGLHPDPRSEGKETANPKLGKAAPGIKWWLLKSERVLVVKFVARK
jgi:hypothetical protein